MTRQVTEQQFNAKTPYYVAQAYQYTDAIFEKGLAEPSDNIWLTSGEAMRIGWDTGHDMLRGLWQQRDEEGSRRYFEADIAMEGTRLCLERDYWRCTAWVYRPPVVRQDWTNNPDKLHPANLISPVLDFSRLVIEDSLPEIRMGLYRGVNEYSSVSFGRKNISDITAESYEQAEYPRLSPKEQPILKQGVHTLHAFKIENMLEVLRLVAR